MFAFFDAIASFIATVVNFVIGIFEMVGNLLSIIFKGVAFLYMLTPNLPPFCMSFLVVTLAVAILLQLINHGS